MRALALIAGLACFGFNAAFAGSDCTTMNSRDFLENVDYDVIIGCMERNPAAITRPNSNGYTFAMTAVSADIDPTMLDYIIWAIPDDLRVAALSAKDPKGRTLAHIAASEALAPGTIFVLSSWGVSPSERIDGATNPAKAGVTPLHLAAARKDGAQIVAALLATGAFPDLDDRDIAPWTVALGVALASPSEGALNSLVLLSEGNWPEIYKSRFRRASLESASDCTQFLTAEFFTRAEKAMVGSCLRSPNQLKSVDPTGNTALHLAAMHTRDPAVIDIMLDRATDPALALAARNSKGMTPLHVAAATGQTPAVVARLLAWGAEKDALLRAERRWVGKNRGTSALHLAASRKDNLRDAFLLNLLAFGADTMVQTQSGTPDDPGGHTALHRASLTPDHVVQLMLLEAQFWQESLLGTIVRSVVGKVVKQIADDAGRTALHIVASRPSDFDSVGVMLVNGFSVDTPDNEGITPLMFAAGNVTDPDVFLLMLESSENPCAVSKSGVTVEGALIANATLMAAGADDTTGKTLSPLGELKQRCP